MAIAFFANTGFLFRFVHNLRTKQQRMRNAPWCAAQGVRMAARKQRIDSATAAVKVMASALDELLPPDHCPLPEAAMPFWRSIVRGRAREEWEATPALLATASSLAWTQWQIVKLREQVEQDPLPDAKAVSRMTDLQRLEMAYLRTLQQHGRGAEGEARDVAKRRSMASGIVADSPLDDDLLARPSVN